MYAAVLLRAYASVFWSGDEYPDRGRGCISYFSSREESRPFAPQYVQYRGRLGYYFARAGLKIPEAEPKINRPSE